MSDAEAAAAMGVSESTVERAKATLREAHPSAVAMLERGEISVTTVLEAVRAEPNVAVQAKWSAADAKERAKQARASTRHSLADATSETDESAVRGEPRPSVRRFEEAQAVERWRTSGRR
jgi:hypothetical protein